MSNELAAFLKARLDEDEAAAKAVLEDPDYEAEWYEPSSGVLYVGPGSKEHPLDGLHPLGDSRLTRFIVSHNPARALREVEAKRAILARHKRVDFDGRTWCDHCTSPAAENEDLVAWPCADVLGLPVVWSSHVDYRDEWKP